MNILHITDLHFGPRHWHGDDNLLLERLNAFNADIVLNTGDNTSDSLPEEYREAGEFLSKLKCRNIFSIIGNHDKFSMRALEMFRKCIYDGEFIHPKDPSKVQKPKLFINSAMSNLEDNFTEVNYLRMMEIDGERVLFVCIDTNLCQKHDGFVEPQILEALRDEMSKLTYDRVLMLSHHSLLATDECPLINSKQVTDFILETGIEATFCGHTHKLDIVEVSDLVRGKKFRQFMCGTLSAKGSGTEGNMFCTYENFGTSDEVITITRVYPTDGGLEFVETVLDR